MLPYNWIAPQPLPPGDPYASTRLVVRYQQKKFMVVVSSDATFKDVKAEIARVYRGISNSPANELVAELCDGNGCILYDNYKVKVLLMDMAKVYAFKHVEDNYISRAMTPLPFNTSTPTDTPQLTVPLSSTYAHPSSVTAIHPLRSDRSTPQICSHTVPGTIQSSATTTTSAAINKQPTGSISSTNYHISSSVHSGYVRRPSARDWDSSVGRSHDYSQEFDNLSCLDDISVHAPACNLRLDFSSQADQSESQSDFTVPNKQKRAPKQSTGIKRKRNKHNLSLSVRSTSRNTPLKEKSRKNMRTPMPNPGMQLSLTRPQTKLRVLYPGVSSDWSSADEEDESKGMKPNGKTVKKTGVGSKTIQNTTYGKNKQVSPWIVHIPLNLIETSIISKKGDSDFDDNARDIGCTDQLSDDQSPANQDTSSTLPTSLVEELVNTKLLFEDSETLRKEVTALALDSTLLALDSAPLALDSAPLVSEQVIYDLDLQNMPDTEGITQVGETQELSAIQHTQRRSASPVIPVQGSLQHVHAADGKSDCKNLSHTAHDKKNPSPTRDCSPFSNNSRKDSTDQLNKTERDNPAPAVNHEGSASKRANVEIDEVHSMFSLNDTSVYDYTSDMSINTDVVSKKSTRKQKLLQQLRRGKKYQSSDDIPGSCKIGISPALEGRYHRRFQLSHSPGSQKRSRKRVKPIIPTKKSPLHRFKIKSKALTSANLDSSRAGSNVGDTQLSPRCNEIETNTSLIGSQNKENPEISTHSELDTDSALTYPNDQKFLITSQLSKTQHLTVESTPIIDPTSHKSNTSPPLTSNETIEPKTDSGSETKSLSKSLPLTVTQPKVTQEHSTSTATPLIISDSSDESSTSDSSSNDELDDETVKEVAKEETKEEAKPSLSITQKPVQSDESSTSSGISSSSDSEESDINKSTGEVIGKGSEQKDTVKPIGIKQTSKISLRLKKSAEMTLQPAKSGVINSLDTEIDDVKPTTASIVKVTAHDSGSKPSCDSDMESVHSANSSNEINSPADVDSYTQKAQHKESTNTYPSSVSIPHLQGSPSTTKVLSKTFSALLNTPPKPITRLRGSQILFTSSQRSLNKSMAVSKAVPVKKAEKSDKSSSGTSSCSSGSEDDSGGGGVIKKRRMTSLASLIGDTGTRNVYHPKLCPEVKQEPPVKIRSFSSLKPLKASQIEADHLEHRIHRRAAVTVCKDVDDIPLSQQEAALAKTGSKNLALLLKSEKFWQ